MGRKSDITKRYAARALALLLSGAVGCVPPEDRPAPEPTPEPTPPAEICNGVDDDGNGWVDDGEGPEFQDLDEDSFSSCAGDCDDDDAGRFPGAPEDACAELDMDCDGVAGVERDSDQDGTPDCIDCAPASALRGQTVNELGANQIDDDCDGWIDEGSGFGLLGELVLGDWPEADSAAWDQGATTWAGDLVFPTDVGLFAQSPAGQFSSYVPVPDLGDVSRAAAVVEGAAGQPLLLLDSMRPVVQFWSYRDALQIVDLATGQRSSLAALIGDPELDPKVAVLGAQAPNQFVVASSSTAYLLRAISALEVEVLATQALPAVYPSYTTIAELQGSCDIDDDGIPEVMLQPHYMMGSSYGHLWFWEPGGDSPMRGWSWDIEEGVTMAPILTDPSFSRSTATFLPAPPFEASQLLLSTDNERPDDIYGSANYATLVGLDPVPVLSTAEISGPGPESYPLLTDPVTRANELCLLDDLNGDGVPEIAFAYLQGVAVVSGGEVPVGRTEATASVPYSWRLDIGDIVEWVECLPGAPTASSLLVGVHKDIGRPWARLLVVAPLASKVGPQGAP